VGRVGVANCIEGYFFVSILQIAGGANLIAKGLIGQDKCLDGLRAGNVWWPIAEPQSIRPPLTSIVPRSPGNTVVADVLWAGDEKGECLKGWKVTDQPLR